ncbi:hypothetical protein [Streptomyces sp. NPDC006012]|uniref:hypothetical protein n=1 Tax=Streptomyces sp. NPDC006012 TaxID=3364739 RepID=UPI0036C9D351
MSDDQGPELFAHWRGLDLAKRLQVLEEIGFLAEELVADARERIGRVLLGVHRVCSHKAVEGGLDPGCLGFRARSFLDQPCTGVRRGGRRGALLGQGRRGVDFLGDVIGEPLSHLGLDFVATHVHARFAGGLALVLAVEATQSRRARRRGAVRGVPLAAGRHWMPSGRVRVWDARYIRIGGHTSS